LSFGKDRPRQVHQNVNCTRLENCVSAARRK
jgi:hypothetical protein